MAVAAETLEREPLEDLMLAMDVVDTLRHRQGLVDRELDADARRERLIERLREIYAAQGIEVTDAVLAEGVSALEEDRFKYDPPASSFSTRLARIYVSRGRWSKVLFGLLALAAVAWSAHYFLVQRPEAQRAAAWPLRVESAYGEIDRVAVDESVRPRAAALRNAATRALQAGDYDEAGEALGDLESLQTRLSQTYGVRIVSRPNALSGVWRVPEVNPNARNYYLIVEAIDPSGTVLKVPIESEEDQTRKTVASWGIRVDEQTFEAVAADKRDDGIIQDDLIGRKVVGKLIPDYVVPTTGATITEW